jgi:threonine dehydratase
MGAGGGAHSSILAPMPLTYRDVQDAAARLAPLVLRTPVISNDELDRRLGGRVFLKCENLQRIGAFKYRGACNAVLQLGADELARGVATHSSGNHAAALARAARERGTRAHVVMPSNVSKFKHAAVAGHGAEIILCEPTMAARDAALAAVVARTGAAVVHPYEDHRVMAGQGTAALELMHEVPELDMLLAPIGGGGLMSGCAVVARQLRARIKLYGVEPAGADDALRSLRAGKVTPVADPDTIADGLRATVGHNTLPILKALLDDIVTVDDAAIVRAMRFLWEHAKIVVEPSGAVPLAALLEGVLPVTGRRIGIIISGGNADLDALPWRASK